MNHYAAENKQPVQKTQKQTRTFNDEKLTTKIQYNETIPQWTIDDSLLRKNLRAAKDIVKILAVYYWSISYINSHT